MYFIAFKKTERESVEMTVFLVYLKVTTEPNDWPSYSRSVRSWSLHNLFSAF